MKKFFTLLFLLIQISSFSQSGSVPAKIFAAPYVDNTGRDICLFWNTESGKSVFYNWSTDISNWKAYSINLPEKPLGETKGNIMMAPYIDNTGRDVCLIWNAETGKSVFYNWSTDISNWKAYSINLPEKPLGETKGKIMMAPYVDKTGRDVCLIWDTETGKSVFYNWNVEISNWKAYSINLPEKPLGETTGMTMMAPYVDNSGRDVCLIWNPETGKSVFYNWSTDISNWKAYSINLPEKPLGETTGKIMMAPYVDNTGRDVCLVWDFKTGKSSYYNWSTENTNWQAYSINLPEKPLGETIGKIMMVPYVDETGRDVCLIWDIDTGTSVFYNWSADISNWKAYSINLPEKPMGY
ncbi:MAG: hypothetical protein KKD31_09330 [Bacteroidetes bacterium]|nr:hypothetical protein [Bacteroidota bacterium]